MSIARKHVIIISRITHCIEGNIMDFVIRDYERFLIV